MIREEQLEIYDLTLTARAPVFIGSGKNYVKKEYIFLDPQRLRVQRAQVLLMDESKFFALLLRRGLVDKYERFMLSSKTDLYRFLTDDCGLKFGEISDVSRYRIGVSDALDSEHSLKEIKAFVRDAHGRAYVPGSSLKGALRTVLLTDMILRENKPRPAPRDMRRGFPEGDYLHTLALKKDRNGRILDDAVNSVMRGFSISDSLPVDDSAMILSGKIDADTRGETQRINICRECVKPGTELKFKLTLDRSVLKDKITAESLMRSINKFDRFYEEKYLRHFTAPYRAADISYENSIILGGGTGFFSKSLLYPAHGEKEGLRLTSETLSRSFRAHRHERDIDLGISPRMVKYGSYGGQLYPYGLCGVSIS